MDVATDSAGHRPRGDGARRAAGRAAAPPAAARARRSHPHLTGRGELRIRSVVDEDAGGSCARSSTGRCSPRSARRSWSCRRCCSSRPIQAAGRRGRRSVRDLRLRRPARRHRAPAARRRRRRPGRDDMSATSTTVDRRSAEPSWSTSTTAVGSVRRAPRRASATSAIRATSCGWSSGAVADHRPRSSSSRSRPTRAPGHRRTSGERWRAPPRRCASSCSALAQVAVVVAAGRHRRRSLVVQRRWRRLGFVVLGRGRRRGARDRCSTACSTCPGGCRTPSPAAPGSPRRASPPRRTSARAAAAATVGKPWLSRSVATRRPTSRCSCSSWRWRSPARAGVPGTPARRRRGHDRRVPPCSSLFGAPNRRPAPAAVAAAPRRERASTLRTLELERAVGGRAQLYRAHDRRRSPAVRQGVQPGQPRRRPPVPRLPHPGAARPERRLAVVVTRR